MCFRLYNIFSLVRHSLTFLVWALLGRWSSFCLCGSLCVAANWLKKPTNMYITRNFADTFLKFGVSVAETDPQNILWALLSCRIIISNFAINFLTFRTKRQQFRQFFRYFVQILWVTVPPYSPSATHCINHFGLTCWSQPCFSFSKITHELGKF